MNHSADIEQNASCGSCAAFGDVLKLAQGCHVSRWCVPCFRNITGQAEAAIDIFTDRYRFPETTPYR